MKDIRIEVSNAVSYNLGSGPDGRPSYESARPDVTLAASLTPGETIQEVYTKLSAAVNALNRLELARTMGHKAKRDEMGIPEWLRVELQKDDKNNALSELMKIPHTI